MNTQPNPARILLKAALAVLTIAVLAVPALAQDMHIYPSEPDLIEIMFIQESMVRLEMGVLVDHSGLNATDGVEAVLFVHGGGDYSRLTPDIPEPMLDDMAFEAELNLGMPVYNLNNIYRIRLLGGADPVIVAYELEMLQGVHLAYPVALPPELPVPGPFTGSQNYLDPAASTPTGVDAYSAWTNTGGDGTGVTICDLEYSWNYNHQDISGAAGSQINNNVADPFADDNHGTAVIGELVSDNNGWGTTGVSYGATLKTCGVYYGLPTPSWNVAGAIAISVTNLTAGDVILLEQQWDYNGNNGYVPVEWYPHTAPQAQTLTAVYAAILNAVGNNISVVEAGGNGGVNTDTMTWFGDSGAVIVGAGGAYTGGTYPNGDLQRLSFSSYGSRFDVQAWGEDVVTTGYGDLHSVEGKNLWYTKGFNGTSSASPIVAGAIACINGYYAANAFGAPPLAPATLRNILKTTGTAQITPPVGSIGPRPDLAAAIASIVIVPPSPWTDVTSGPLGVIGSGLGVSWGDIDMDGDPDLYVTDQAIQNFCLRNDGGGTFTDTTTPVEANLMISGGSELGDFNNDGLPDIYMGNFGGPNRIFQSGGPGVFMDAATPPADDPQDGGGITWVDFDNDGMLDVHVTTMNGGIHRLFQNAGGGIFNDVTTPLMAMPFDSHDAAWSDFDNDGDMDCYVINLNAPNDLLVNMGGGNFIPFGDPALMDPAVGSGACWGDFDGDGWMDLYLVNRVGANRMYRNNGGMFFIDVTSGPEADPAFGFGASCADYDNDGDLDIYLANGCSANRLLRNEGGFIFTDQTSGPLFDTPRDARGTAWADYDMDGDQDIYLVNNGSTNKLFNNGVVTGNHWVQLDFQGFNCNMSAIGTRVRVVTAGISQIREVGVGAGFCSQNDLRVHFGLGGFTFIDSLIVDWPGYGKETFLNLPVDVFMAFSQHPLSPVPDNPVLQSLQLHPGVPNPFNPATRISFELSASGPIELAIFDIAGRKIQTLATGHRNQGPHSEVWHGIDDQGRTQPSGVYFAQLLAKGQRKTTKLVLMK